HNAAFDIEVICATLDEYKQPFHEFAYLCTMIISRYVWPDLPGVSLKAVAHSLGIQFQHHNAKDDAFACAQVAVAAAKAVGASDILDLQNRISVQPGKVWLDGHTPCWISPTPENQELRTGSSLQFLVEGSTGNEYEIVASRIGNHFRMTCTCEAGQNKVFCKHRAALLNGSADDLISDNESDLIKLANFMAGTGAELRIKTVHHLEEQKAEIDARLRVEKKALGREMGASNPPFGSNRQGELEH